MIREQLSICMTHTCLQLSVNIYKHRFRNKVKQKKKTDFKAKYGQVYDDAKKEILNGIEDEDLKEMSKICCLLPLQFDQLHMQQEKYPRLLKVLKILILMSFPMNLSTLQSFSLLLMKMKEYMCLELKDSFKNFPIVSLRVVMQHLRYLHVCFTG